MSHTIVWDSPYYYIGGKRFIPEIGQNTLPIILEGHMQSDLNWDFAYDLAKKAMDSGKMIYWQMNLGLFSSQGLSIDNQTLFQSLCLALEHFRDGLWKQFESHSLGLSLYQGSPDFSTFLPWNEGWKEQYREWCQECFSDTNEDKLRLRFFCRNALAEYLTLLARRLPDALPCYVTLDCSHIQNPIEQLQMLYPECWEGVNLHLINPVLPLISLGKDPLPSSLGLCLPSIEKYLPENDEKWEHLLGFLIQSKQPFRLIAESHLTTQWRGLDLLIYDENRISAQGKRKIQGFEAAGGTAIALGEPEYQAWINT